ncbi:MAG: (S)-ureidoglycine aminohydrolase [Planctomycetota bacterium]
MNPNHDEHETLRPLGQTRTRVLTDHAVIGPDSHVPAPLAGWENTQGVVLISPAMGASPRNPGFVQTLVHAEADSTCAGAPKNTQRFVYVLSGQIRVDNRVLSADGYAWLPPGSAMRLVVVEPGRLLVFDKPYAALPGVPTPDPVFGHADDAVAEPFMGDPHARLAALLPDNPAFDLAINRFTFDPGTPLPLVETHVNEHGLYLQHGAGVYRLGSGSTETWTPIAAGDSIWMAAYCPQWFVAMGTEPATYIYYKNVNRPVIGSAV